MGTCTNSYRTIFTVLICLGLHSYATVSAKRFHSIAGPFRIIVRRIEQCPSEFKQDAGHWSIKDVSTRETYKKGPTYNINVTMTKTILDDISSLRIVVASWSNVAGWKDNAHIFNFKKACETLTVYGVKMWVDFWMSVAGEMWHCPYPEGFYRYENFTMDWGVVPIPAIFYGRWRADFLAIHANGNVGMCVRSYIDTVPR